MIEFVVVHPFEGHEAGTVLREVEEHRRTHNFVVARQTSEQPSGPGTVLREVEEEHRRTHNFVVDRQASEQPSANVAPEVHIAEEYHGEFE